MALTTIHDPRGRKHVFDSSKQTFQGFQLKTGQGRAKSIQGDIWTPQFTEAAPPAPAPEPEPTRADELKNRADAQQAQQDAYFDQKIAEVENLIPDPPAQQQQDQQQQEQEPVDRTPTAVDQGATVKDLQIASEGDNEAALARRAAGGIGVAAQKRRRSSLLSIPTY